MTPQQIVGMAVRLFAIWLVMIAFQLYMITSALEPRLSDGGKPVVYLVAALPAVIAVLLWRFPMFVAHKMVPRTLDTNIRHIPAREATAAGTALIGIWAVIATVPHLFAAFGLRFFGADPSLASAYATPERMQQTLGLLSQCALGIFLIAKPWFVAGRVFPDGAGDAGESA
jgi:hypothetical protein